MHVISGPKFVSLSCTKERCAPNSARKGPMVWRFSSDVTVLKDCLAKSGKMPPTLQKQDFMCARRSDDTEPVSNRPWTLCTEYAAAWWNVRTANKSRMTKVTTVAGISISIDRMTFLPWRGMPRQLGCLHFTVSFCQ